MQPVYINVDPTRINKLQFQIPVQETQKTKNNAVTDAKYADNAAAKIEKNKPAMMPQVIQTAENINNFNPVQKKLTGAGKKTNEKLEADKQAAQDKKTALQNRLKEYETDAAADKDALQNKLNAAKEGRTKTANDINTENGNYRLGMQQLNQSITQLSLSRGSIQARLAELSAAENPDVNAINELNEQIKNIDTEIQQAEQDKRDLTAQHDQKINTLNAQLQGYETKISDLASEDGENARDLECVKRDLNQQIAEADKEIEDIGVQIELNKCGGGRTIENEDGTTTEEYFKNGIKYTNIKNGNDVIQSSVEKPNGYKKVTTDNPDGTSSIETISQTGRRTIQIKDTEGAVVYQLTEPKKGTKRETLRAEGYTQIVNYDEDWNIKRETLKAPDNSSVSIKYGNTGSASVTKKDAKGNETSESFQDSAEFRAARFELFTSTSIDGAESMQYSKKGASEAETAQNIFNDAAGDINFLGNNDGDITFEEFYADNGNSLDKGSAEAIFNMIDMNSGGRVTADEYASYKTALDSMDGAIDGKMNSGAWNQFGAMDAIMAAAGDKDAQNSLAKTRDIMQGLHDKYFKDAAASMGGSEQTSAAGQTSSAEQADNDGWTVYPDGHKYKDEVQPDGTILRNIDFTGCAGGNWQGITKGVIILDESGSNIIETAYTYAKPEERNGIAVIKQDGSNNITAYLDADGNEVDAQSRKLEEDGRIIAPDGARLIKA